MMATTSRGNSSLGDFHAPVSDDEEQAATQPAPDSPTPIIGADGTSFEDAIREGNEEAAKEAAEEKEANEGPKKKKRKQSKLTLDAEKLLDEKKGVVKIAAEFPKIKFSKAKHSERKNLSVLMAHYATWANELFPAMAFPDLITKIESLGQKRQVKDYMSDIRFRFETNKIELVAAAQERERAAARSKEVEDDAEDFQGDGLGSDNEDVYEEQRQHYQMDDEEEEENFHDEDDGMYANVVTRAPEKTAEQLRAERLENARAKREMLLAKIEAAKAEKQRTLLAETAEDGFSMSEDDEDGDELPPALEEAPRHTPAPTPAPATVVATSAGLFADEPATQPQPAAAGDDDAGDGEAMEGVVGTDETTGEPVEATLSESERKSAQVSAPATEDAAASDDGDDDDEPPPLM